MLVDLNPVIVFFEFLTGSDDGVYLVVGFELETDVVETANLQVIIDEAQAIKNPRNGCSLSNWSAAPQLTYAIITIGTKYQKLIICPITPCRLNELASFMK